MTVLIGLGHMSALRLCSFFVNEYSPLYLLFVFVPMLYPFAFMHNVGAGSYNNTQV